MFFTVGRMCNALIEEFGENSRQYLNFIDFLFSEEDMDNIENYFWSLMNNNSQNDAFLKACY